jgi:hypothetical protein
LEYPPGIPGIVVETDTREFLLLVGLLVALTIVVLALLASQQLRHVCQQLTAPDRPDAENEPGNGRPTTAWGWLQRRAIREGGPSKDEPTTAAVRELFHATTPPPEDEELSPELKPRMRVNALLVIAAYQALVLVPVGIAAFGVGFQFPVLLVFLQLVGVITPQQLRKGRRYAIVVIVVVLRVLGLF